MCIYYMYENTFTCTFFLDFGPVPDVPTEYILGIDPQIPNKYMYAANEHHFTRASLLLALLLSALPLCLLFPLFLNLPLSLLLPMLLTPLILLLCLPLTLFLGLLCLLIPYGCYAHISQSGFHLKNNPREDK